jgi:protein TonB
VSARLILRRRTGPPLRFVPPRWDAKEASDPFGAALELHADRRMLIVATAAATLLYGGGTIFAISARVGAIAPTTQTELPVVQALPPAPPPTPPPPLEEPHPVQPRRLRRAAAPPPPAEASQVLTRAPDAPIDLSSFTIATGHAATYGGGYTSGNGTNHGPVSSPNVARTPHPARAGAGQARAAQPARRDWSCGWPEDAQETDLRETRVIVKVDVSADGDPTAVEVQGGALSGFGDAARRCALSEQYRPALDATGRRVPGQTPLLMVHFVR